MTVRTLRKIAALGLLATIVGMTGCSDSKTVLAPPHNSTNEPHGQPLAGSSVQFFGESDADAQLATAMAQADVGAAFTLLESEGYSYVDTNSLVLTQRHFTVAAPDVHAQHSGRGKERSTGSVRVYRADTVAWFAFENPTRDMENHTAVLNLRSGDASMTVLVELDVGKVPPAVIREAIIVDGQVNPGDVGTQGWLGCVYAGGWATGIGCLATNCGYGACLGAGAAATLAGCTASWLWDRFVE